ncbi:MAG: hypothetical protein ACRCTQ_05415 [Brevinemataceae bacterium]
MKTKTLILGIAAGIITGSILTLIISSLAAKNKPTESITISLPTIDKLDSSHLAKIEQYGVSLKDFTNAYNEIKKTLPPEQLQQLDNNEPAYKSEILETMINQYVVVATALEEGFLENQENARLFQNAIQQALFQLYVAKNMPQDENAFAPTKAEIDQIYAQYGSELRARGLNAQQSRDTIIAQINQQKRQRWMIDFISKIKEGYRIERNNELLKKENISATGIPQNLQF